MTPLEPGSHLLHFQVEVKLGEGGMGEVYRAVDTKLGRPVAIKVLPSWATAEIEAAARFRQEARLASALNHPHIVTIYSVEKADSCEFIVMELVEGQTLLQIAKAQPSEYAQVLAWVEQVADALGAAHAIGLIHRDIKPSNILITREGRAKIADFGLAKRLHSRASDLDTTVGITRPGHVLGSPAYMSPEQVRGEQLDGRTDIFSLGIALYEALTGRRPFLGATVLAVANAIATEEPAPVTRFRPDIPTAVDQIIALALAKSPAERFSDANEFARELRALLDGAVGQRVTSTMQRVRAERVPNNLPAQLTSFVGRERECSEVKNLLSTARLVTVIGVGGCGKTRLAIQVASELLAELQGGAWLVELGALADPTLVPQAAAGALGVREVPGSSLLATLADSIGQKSLLLVLDNCEHLAGACAALAESLLRACPNLRILATSQEPLGTAGEIAWRISTLSVPDVRVALPRTKEEAERFDAVRLFVERAAASHGSFSLTDSNAATVAQICHRLDGIPLAIELAAVRVKVLAVDGILGRLEDRFQLLTGGRRTALPRQQTLRAAVDWSYELLTQKERSLLNRLGVFAGGCSLEAVEAICAWGELEKDGTLDLLTHLVDKSLVGPHEGSDGAMRYSLLETIRAYARERSVDGGEWDALEERHASSFLDLAERIEPKLQGPDQALWLDQLEDEHDNLRQAIQHFASRHEADHTQRLCGALWRFWWVRGNWREGRDYLEDALALDSASRRTIIRSKALRAAAVLARGQGDFDAAQAFLGESLEIAREKGDRAGIAAALFELGNVANEHLRLDEARSLYEECLSIRREIGDRTGIALALHNLAVVAEAGQDFVNAGKLYEEALSLHRDLGNRGMEANTLNGLGFVAVAIGDLAGAQQRHEQALSILREIDDRRGIAFSLRELGSILVARDDLAGAGACLGECMIIMRDLGDRQGLAATMEACAGVAAAAGKAETAFQLSGAAAALREAIGSPLSQTELELFEAKLAPARVAIGEDAARHAFEDGKGLPSGDAIAIASEFGSEG